MNHSLTVGEMFGCCLSHVVKPFDAYSADGADWLVGGYWSVITKVHVPHQLLLPSLSPLFPSCLCLSFILDLLICLPPSLWAKVDDQHTHTHILYQSTHAHFQQWVTLCQRLFPAERLWAAWRCRVTVAIFCCHGNTLATTDGNVERGDGKINTSTCSQLHTDACILSIHTWRRLTMWTGPEAVNLLYEDIQSLLTFWPSSSTFVANGLNYICLQTQS